MSIEEKRPAELTTADLDVETFPSLDRDGLVTVIHELRLATMRALEYAVRYGGIEGDHHKAWVIDQMVRALTLCPIVESTARDHRGELYAFKTQGESDEYRLIVADAKAGDDGPDTYSWETGIAP